MDMQNLSVTVLAEQLVFPNGLELTPDRSALLFPSTSRALIQQYHLKGTLHFLWLLSSPH